MLVLLAILEYLPLLMILFSTNPFSHLSSFSMISLNVLRHCIYKGYFIGGMRFSLNMSTCMASSIWLGYLMYNVLHLCRKVVKVSVSFCFVLHKSIRLTRLFMLWENFEINNSANYPHELILGGKCENHSSAGPPRLLGKFLIDKCLHLQLLCKRWRIILYDLLDHPFSILVELWSFKMRRKGWHVEWPIIWIRSKIFHCVVLLVPSYLHTHHFLL